MCRETDAGGTGEVARQIARAAARLFAERGYDATSVREIVEAAGVTKPTLYYHFGSKEGLAQALLTVPMTRLLGDLARRARGEPDPVANLAAEFEAHFEFIREDPDRAGSSSPCLRAARLEPGGGADGFGRRAGAETLQEGSAAWSRPGTSTPTGPSGSRRPSGG